MPSPRPTLLMTNTVDRLLRGDLFHTVTIDEVQERLASFPADWHLIGVGTTNWMQRNGELIAGGRVDEPHFWWADPESEPIGHLVDLAAQHPGAGTPLVTPQYGVDDSAPHFPFVAIAVCQPDASFTLQGNQVSKVHEWLIAELAARNTGVCGVHVEGIFSSVKTTDAYNIPLGGLKLTEGYVGDAHFRYGDYERGRWQMKGIYAANPSLQPFISVVGLPLHLHGFEQDRREGGHIVSAAAVEVSATIYRIDDLNLTIHNVAQAMNPIKPT